MIIPENTAGCTSLRTEIFRYQIVTTYYIRTYRQTNEPTLKIIAAQVMIIPENTAGCASIRTDLV